MVRLQIAFLFFFVSSLGASTLSEISLGDLSGSAAWIGRIKIISKVSVDGDSIPSSRIRAEVVEVLKGEGRAGESLSFVVPGGKRGSRSFKVVGFPNFKEQGEYLVFLTENPFVSNRGFGFSGAAQLAGWTAFRVLKAEQTYVVRAGDSTLLGASSNGYQMFHDRSVRTYEDFVGEIFRSMN